MWKDDTSQCCINKKKKKKNHFFLNFTFNSLPKIKVGYYGSFAVAYFVKLAINLIPPTHWGYKLIEMVPQLEKYLKENYGFLIFFFIFSFCFNFNFLQMKKPTRIISNQVSTFLIIGMNI